MPPLFLRAHRPRCCAQDRPPRGRLEELVHHEVRILLDTPTEWAHARHPGLEKCRPGLGKCRPGLEKCRPGLEKCRPGGSVRRMENGYELSSELYLILIETLCAHGRWEQALQELTVMKENPKLKVTAAHFNPVIRAQAKTGDEKACFLAYRTFFRMVEGSSKTAVEPDVSTYNALLEGFASGATQATKSADKIMELIGSMFRTKNKPTPKTYVLAIEGFARAEAVGQAMRSLHALRRLIETMQADAEPGAQLDQLKDSGLGGSALLQNTTALPVLVDAVACYGDADMTFELLNMLRADGVKIQSSHFQEDTDGHSLVTRWMFYRNGHRRTPVGPQAPSLKELAQAEQERREEEEAAAAKEEQKKKQDAAIASGKPIALSKMTVAQLRAELESYGLPTHGKRTVLYKRMQAVRSAIKEEADVVEAIIELEGEEVLSYTEEPKASKKAAAKKGEAVSSTGWVWKNGRRVEVANQDMDNLVEGTTVPDWMKALDDQAMEDARAQKEDLQMDELKKYNAAQQENTRPDGDASVGEATDSEQESDGAKKDTSASSTMSRLELSMAILKAVTDMGGAPNAQDCQALMEEASAAGSVEDVQLLVHYATCCKPMAAAETFMLGLETCIRMEERVAAFDCLLAMEEAGAQPNEAMIQRVLELQVSPEDSSPEDA
ncbi:hypothetical protein CYMTET_27905 [Cymbomonas tetramitiformis]|uniref:SAP domain-containing protein n=1 Tax=Cymbomonas tetramitiformis TaxID=36881 RepID=A0AAE0KWH0_9CHLO|nr:hypothetical protein CYMTET_27905 [Cymbomonas tetramitiformis]